MILLDWTRMGRSYCLAGAVAQSGGFRVVRPLPVKERGAAVRKVSWSAYLLDGHSRWEVFELLAPEPAAGEPPHLEDLWVRSLHPRRALAAPADRRAILLQTAVRPGESLFGAPLTSTRSAAYLKPGTGQRSLATVIVPTADIRFHASWREGAEEPDVRVALPLPELAGRQLPVKDHHLLQRAELAGASLEGRLKTLALAVQQMGEQVAVRLGLSRAFHHDDSRAPAACWLMADGFFSLADPQP
jgi:hypothetical protein